MMRWFLLFALVLCACSDDGKKASRPIAPQQCNDNVVCQQPPPAGRRPVCASDTLSTCDMSEGLCHFVVATGCACFVGQTQSCPIGQEDCDVGERSCRNDGSGFAGCVRPATCPRENQERACPVSSGACTTGKQTYKGGKWGPCVASCTGACTPSAPENGCNQGVFVTTNGQPSCRPQCDGDCSVSPPRNNCSAGIWSRGDDGRMVCRIGGGSSCVDPQIFTLWCGTGTLQCETPTSTTEKCVPTHACPDPGLRELHGTLIAGPNLGDGRWVSALRAGGTTYQLGPISGFLGESLWNLATAGAEVTLLHRPWSPGQTLVAEDFYITRMTATAGDPLHGIIHTRNGVRTLSSSSYVSYPLNPSTALNVLRDGDHVYVVSVAQAFPGDTLNVAAAGRLSPSPWPPGWY